jgi:hypothetical protein
VADAAGRLTTAVAVKLDPTRHAPEVANELESLLHRHKGNTEVYLQVSTRPDQRVVLRLDRDRWVKPTKALVEELERLLGAGSVQLCGLGARRRKKAVTVQQPLFQDQVSSEAPLAAEEGAVAPEAVLDAEMAAAEAEI